MTTQSPNRKPTSVVAVVVAILGGAFVWSVVSHRLEARTGTPTEPAVSAPQPRPSESPQLGSCTAADIARLRAAGANDDAIIAKCDPPKPAPPRVEEIDKPGSRALLASLKVAGLYPSPVEDFAHLHGGPDMITFSMADSFQSLDRGTRQMIAKQLWVLWARAREPDQKDSTKCRVELRDGSGTIIAASTVSNSSFVDFDR